MSGVVVASAGLFPSDAHRIAPIAGQYKGVWYTIKSGTSGSDVEANASTLEGGRGGKHKTH